MKKVNLIILTVLALVFFGSLPIYAHSGGGGSSSGGGNGDTWGTQEFTLEPFGFESVSQTGISDGTLDIHNIPPLSEEELEQRIRADKERDQAWAQIDRAGWTLAEHILHAGEIGTKITVFIAGVGLSVLASPAELSAAIALAVGAGYSVVTTYITSDSSEDGAKAGVQTLAISLVIQNAPITGSLVDLAVSNLPTPSTQQTSTPRNDLVDYGPGSETTSSGQTQMK